MLDEKMIEKMFEEFWNKERGGFPVNEDHIPVTEKQLYKWEKETFKAAINLLLPIIKKQDEAISFYSKPMTYFSDHEGGGFGYISEDDREDLEMIIPEFGDEEIDLYEEVGGKLARSTKQEVSEMINKLKGELK